MSKVLAPSSPLSKTSACNSGTCFENDTKTDTSIKEFAKLYDFGGDVSKRWFIDYFENNQRKRKWIPANPEKTKPERAKKELQKILQLYKGNSYNLTTLVEKMELRPKSKQTYLTDIKILNDFCPDMKYFDQKEFLIFLKSKYGPKTQRNKINNLKSVFNFGISEGLINENPLADLRGTDKIVETDFNFPYSDFERSIIEPELLKNKGLYLFTRFIYYTFSRPKELLSLRVRDIDLRNRTVKILAENSKTKKIMVKPIFNPLLDLIIEYKILENPSSAFIFSNSLLPGFTKCPINLPNNLHRDLLKKLNIYRNRETVLYSWKHTGNIQAYLSGMDIKIIQKVNGHSSILTTEIYLKKLGLFLDKQAYQYIF